MTHCLWLFLSLSLGFAADGNRIVLETDAFSLLPYPGHVKVGKAHQIYIADLDAPCIRVFDAKGTYLFKIGRAGEGPGEFKRWFGEFDIGPDQRVYQVDFWAGNRWINVFEPDGTFVRIIQLSAFEGNFGPQRVFAVNDRQLIVGIENNWHADKQGPLYFNGADQSYHLLSAEGKREKQLVTRTMLHEISKYPDREGRPIPNQAFFLCAVDRSGKRFAYQKSDEAEVTLVDLVSGASATHPNGFHKRRAGKESIEAFVEDRLANFTPAEYRTYETQLYGDLIKYADNVDQFQGIVDRLWFNPEGVLFASFEHPQTHACTVARVPLDGTGAKVFDAPGVPEAYMGDKAVFLIRDEEAGQGYLDIRPRGAF